MRSESSQLSGWQVMEGSEVKLKSSAYKLTRRLPIILIAQF